MKKNFFATLIIAALIVIMSFLLTSCDIFDRGNGSGSSGSKDGVKIDKSKLSESASESLINQIAAIDEEFFDAVKEGYVLEDGTKVVINLTREDIINVIAATNEDDPYRGLIYKGEVEDPEKAEIYGYSDGKYRAAGGYIVNNEFYDYLKRNETSLDDFFGVDVDILKNGLCMDPSEVGSKNVEMYMWSAFATMYWFGPNVNMTKVKELLGQLDEIFSEFTETCVMYKTDTVSIAYCKAAGGNKAAIAIAAITEKGLFRMEMPHYGYGDCYRAA